MSFVYYKYILESADINVPVKAGTRPQYYKFISLDIYLVNFQTKTFTEKLGQQAPSFGYILAYLETTAKKYLF